jgi:serine beta-lactamase-like protein LACTB, mitochondrial
VNSFRLGLAVLLFFTAPRLAVANDLDSAKVAEVERILTSWRAQNHIPGLSAAVALDGRIVWSRAYGLADLEGSVTAQTDTAYRSASIGKALTATAALRLVEAGKLDLDAPVQRYCSAFPAKQWPLSTRELLRHMGGVRHYGGARDAEEQFSTRHYRSVAEALEPFRDDPLAFEPGTRYLYSTYGYDVVGCVLEGAAGSPYMEVMAVLVFSPAGMTATRADDPAAIVPRRAAGYVRGEGGLRNAPHVDMSNRLPAGGFLTTAPDLASFAIAFLDCKLVSCATRDLMLTPQATGGGEVVSYGLGWGLTEPGDDWYGEVEAFHGGSSPGASGMLYTIPRRRFAVAILTNLESAPERSDTAAAIAAVVLDLRAATADDR